MYSPTRTMSPQTFERDEESVVIQRKLHESENQRLSLEREVSQLREQITRMAKLQGMGPNSKPMTDTLMRKSYQ